MVFCQQPDSAMRFQECTDGNRDGTYKAGTMSCSFQLSNNAQRLACLDQIATYYCYPGAGGAGGTAGAGGVGAGAGTAVAAGDGGVTGTAGAAGGGGVTGTAGAAGGGGVTGTAGAAGSSGGVGGSAGSGGDAGTPVDGGVSCADLPSEYASALQVAERCTVDAGGQCARLAGAAFPTERCGYGCGMIYVNDTTAFGPIFEAAIRDACLLEIVCNTFCQLPTGGVCIATDGGTGRCETTFSSPPP
jgi:hypothetical protein